MCIFKSLTHSSVPTLPLADNDCMLAVQHVIQLWRRCTYLYAYRVNKLAPLAPVTRGQGSAANSGAAGKVSVSSEGLKEELRRAGLLGSPDGHASNSSSPGTTESAGITSSDKLVDAFVEQEQESISATIGPGTAARLDGRADLDLDSESELELQAVADSTAAGYTAAAQDRGRIPAAGVYGSAAGADFSSDDESSDDFGIEEQRQLFEAARRQLSQGGQQQRQLSSQQQQQPVQADQDHVHDVYDLDSNSELEIPEDISLPLEVRTC